MPIYQVVTVEVDLGKTQRDRLAAGLTEIHHDETQAPEPFIRVVFQPLPLGLAYTAGRVEPSFLLSCGIRAGRSEATRHSILRRCYDLVRDVTDLPPTQIFVAAPELLSSWLLEAGLILPEPNPEAERTWVQELERLYPGQLGDVA